MSELDKLCSDQNKTNEKKREIISSTQDLIHSPSYTRDTMTWRWLTMKDDEQQATDTKMTAQPSIEHRRTPRLPRCPRIRSSGKQGIVVRRKKTPKQKQTFTSTMLLLCTKEVIVDATEGKATTVQIDGNANNIAVVFWHNAVFSA